MYIPMQICASFNPHGLFNVLYVGSAEMSSPISLSVGRSIGIAKCSNPTSYSSLIRTPASFPACPKTSSTLTIASSNDPRIKELCSHRIKAWFSDLGNGNHDGGPNDPG
ncbi:hypothetical protein CC78DRAFT_40926 [Lojkania enalia]|uniref:Uncharacterized protein n=1 Tax=Lojkania enalia TaxID=147567 RepID=A0A9P4K0S5_9PLEO|nr:hypothetical protein CC78DRAFT_40926 [Didymosphaeria enalia]